MTNFRDYIFVLCGHRFEEIAAAIFVAVLREAGLRVKVVGLTSQRINGSHGLALVPDLTLDQALPLAAKTTCLIIPYTSQGIKRLKNDPRLRKLFYGAHANNAMFVIGQLYDPNLEALELFPSSANNFVVYPGNEDLVEFAREFANSLAVVV